MKTFRLKAKDIHRKWYLIDAEDLVLGRLASVVAKLLRGKHDPAFSPHLDHGGCVVLINAEKVYLTGGKDKIYYRHTGYPGGIKQSLSSEILKGPFAARVLEKAVDRMLGSSGPLRRQRMRHLYVYAGKDHPHEAQRPELLDISSWNVKNKRRESSSEKALLG